MTDTELLNAVVVKLAAGATNPLAAMSVQARDQLGDETEEGLLTVILGECNTHASGVGTQREDAVTLLMRGVLTFADTAVSGANAELLAQQITDTLLANQQITPLDDATDPATCCNRDPIRRRYGFIGEGDAARRAVEVDVTYYKTPG